jgi:predicted nucleic acid-binding protein
MFAAIFSSRGGAREILRLGVAGLLQVLVSQDVLAELEENLQRKAPRRLVDLAVAFEEANLALVNPPDITTIQQCQRLIGYADDSVVLAAALAAQVDFFVTLDRQHFLDNEPLRAALPFPMGTPGDCLAWYRRQVD